MKFVFLRDELKFLEQSEIKYEIVESIIHDEHWCLINATVSPDLLFKAFRSGIYASINKININDFA